MSGFEKQGGSRPNIYQVIQYNSATNWTTKFGVATQQIRVMSQLAGWGAVCDSTNAATFPTSAGGIGMFITGVSTGYPAAGGTSVTGSPYPEYFAVTPGQIFAFSTTSTSTGALSITEMA